MPRQHDNQELLKLFGEVEDLVSKAQITRGDNSERKSWAGSDWEEQEMPSVTPNGTDYEPQRTIKRATNKKPFRKSVGEASIDELQAELRRRESGLPNLEGARSEFLKSFPGSETVTCGICDGSSLNKSMDAECDGCNGFGFKFRVPKDYLQKASDFIVDLSDRYNVSAYTDMLLKAQGECKGGGDEDADPTPKKPGPNNEETEHFKVPSIKKGDIQEEMAGMEGELSKMGKMCKGMDEDEDFDMDDDFDMDKAKKSLALQREAINTLMEGQQAILKGLRSVLDNNDTVYKGLRSVSRQQGTILDLNVGTLKTSSALLKGLLEDGAESYSEAESINKSQGARSRQPMRSPRAAARNVEALEKSFGPASDNEQIDGFLLKKSASHMLLTNPERAKKTQLTAQHVIALEHGAMPQEDIVKSLIKYAEEVGEEELRKH